MRGRHSRNPIATPYPRWDAVSELMEGERRLEADPRRVAPASRGLGELGGAHPGAHRAAGRRPAARVARSCPFFPMRETVELVMPAAGEFRKAQRPALLEEGWRHGLVDDSEWMVSMVPKHGIKRLNLSMVCSMICIKEASLRG